LGGSVLDESSGVLASRAQLAGDLRTDGHALARAGEDNERPEKQG
jgi:hypothetical protein